MALQLTAGDVLDIATQLELDACAFYRKAAALAQDKELAKQLRSLADMEATHAAEFRELKRLLGEKDAKLDEETARYLRAFARNGYFNVSVDAAKVLAEQPTKKDILTFALERQRDAIAFYTGIRAMLPKRKGRDKIEAIILQETGHVGLLQSLLERL